jgi:hypothetical protein
MQIDRTNWAEIILSEFPAFRPQWAEHLDSWNPIITRPIALDLAEFADFAIDLIWAGDERELDRLATAIELMFAAEDPLFTYTICQTVLEKIDSRSDVAGFPIERFTNKFQPYTATQWQAVKLDRSIDLSIHH